ncbi:UDP-N-acetylglucosamine 2-epimerase [Halorubrum sp. PV6]|uniref:UDP-N-acetylglucosamine 2-epimerase n=1 Tax=Halorubrum sp. PV6 TaxID=634157 RepID=UPI000EB6F60B|nr:UDP-N-acetylglucosamine 2-epimerase [Halorubrum sp. PV6]AYD49520.1 NDP-GlcNAc-hydrolase/2-epimerase [Halorubrum sp. PV6]AZQ14282.1 UDP-N-acetylglucosamine 2-epimerase (hydrolyzing) [Halorubrum sp. PV6]
MTTDTRNVAVLTGTRAEYGLLKPAMEAVQNHEALSLSVVATGMHLSPKHGMTVDDIRADGFTVDREVLMQVDGDSGTAMAKSLGVGVMGLTDAFNDLDPDIVLLLGDRDEALAGALAAAHMNIPIAHIHGGDSMYGAVIDDSIRHAITKFAHIHFPASDLSAERIRKMGEEEWRIMTAGAPGLDDILAGEYMDPEVVLEKYNLDPGKPSILVVQHPITTQPDQAGDQMAETLDAVESFDAQVILIYPNSDAGGDTIISEIESRDDTTPIRTFRSLPRREYLGIMDAVDVMVGNSSGGIIEAPSFSLPVVDVGPRQEGRERAENTLSVAHNSSEIRDAIRMCLDDPEFQQRVERYENPYDYGGAGRLIADHLSEVDLNEDLIRKRLTY